MSACHDLHLLQQSQTYLLPSIPLVLVFNNCKIQATTEIGPNTSVVGTLEIFLEKVLLLLFNASLARMQALIIPPFNFTNDSGRRKRPSGSTQKLDIVINLYGSQAHATLVGRFLSEAGIFLQHPKFPEPGHMYKNPHFLSRPGALALFTQCTPTGGVTDIKTTQDRLEMETPASRTDLSKIFDGLWETDTLDEHNGDQRLATPLLRCIFYINPHKPRATQQIIINSHRPQTPKARTIFPKKERIRFIGPWPP